MIGHKSLLVVKPFIQLLFGATSSSRSTKTHVRVSLHRDSNLLLYHSSLRRMTSSIFDMMCTLCAYESIPLIGSVS